MSFLHPEFLWLAPLVALPILIHLLNRVRYRRMRWAAMAFLLATERRAVRRARLRQILLMVLRTVVLAAALGALAQPILSGGLASLLGGTNQVAVLLDVSASMSAADASGSAFDRARRAAAAEVAALPRGTRAAAIAFSARADATFRAPVQDHGAVARTIESADLTSAATDVPQAIRAAAESLGRGGGGGTIWILTDLRAAGWHAGGPGAWDDVRTALQAAGNPRLLVSDCAPAIAANLSVSKVRVSPDLLLEGDVPRLTATVTLQVAGGDSTGRGAAGPARRSLGEGGATAKAALHFDGQLVDTQSVQFGDAGDPSSAAAVLPLRRVDADVVFHLPALGGPAHAGWIELEHDALPADDRSYFVLRPAESIPVLVVSGQVSSIPFESSGDFLASALEPPPSEAAARSPFAVKTIPAAQLAGTSLGAFAAVCLADVARPDAETVRALRAYVEAGGLLVIFPGAHTDAAAWNAAGLLDVRFESIVQAEGEKRMKVNWTSPTSPVTATLATEGLDRLAISRALRLAPAPADEVLATMDGGGPFLVRSQLGLGKVYIYAVSCQQDFSNLPFCPVLLLTVHRMLHAHLVETGEPLAMPALATLEFPVRPGENRVVTPGGQVVPLTVHEGRPDRGSFDRTGQAGIYRLASGDVPAGHSPSAGDGPTAEAARGPTPIAAVNVPPEESALARIAPTEIRSLLQGSPVYFLATDGNISQLQSDAPASSAVSGFPLAALAIAFLLGEVILAWSMSRPAAGAAKPSPVGPAPVKA